MLGALARIFILGVTLPTKPWAEAIAALASLGYAHDGRLVTTTMRGLGKLWHCPISNVAWGRVLEVHDTWEVSERQISVRGEQE